MEEGEADLGVEPGVTIAGRYRLEKLLGKGGMGSVWRAAHLELGSPVAVKIIRPKVGQNANSRARFLREAKAAAMLRSPHVVQIIEHGEQDGLVFIVMEMLEGESLLTRLKRERRLDAGTTAHILTHIGRAMTRAHEAGITHRDLKPDNVFLVDNDDEVLAKVLDFGIAKSHLDALNLTGESPHTQTGALLGTPYYMSPEQATASKDVDHRADLWAMGVIAYECIVGKRPYRANNLGDLVLNICSRPQPIPSDKALVAAGFDAWFAKAQARDPDLRYQSAKELVRALRQVLLGDAANLTMMSAADQRLSSSPGRIGGDRERLAHTAEAAEAKASVVPFEPASEVGPPASATTDRPMTPLDGGEATLASGAAPVASGAVGAVSAASPSQDTQLETLDALAATHGAPRRPSWMVGAVAGGLFLVAGGTIAWQLTGRPRPTEDRAPAAEPAGDGEPSGPTVTPPAHGRTDETTNEPVEPSDAQPSEAGPSAAPTTAPAPVTGSTAPSSAASSPLPAPQPAASPPPAARPIPRPVRPPPPPPPSDDPLGI